MILIWISILLVMMMSPSLTFFFRDGYDSKDNLLHHPVYYLFIFNLINLITAVEMQLGTSPFNYNTKYYNKL